MTTDRGAEMYKGFFEDMEYVMGLFFKPFEGCCAEEYDTDEDEEKKCGMGCDVFPCMKNEEDEEEPEKESEEGHSAAGGLLGPGPMQDIMKCMFDASDIDYDYED